VVAQNSKEKSMRKKQRKVLPQTANKNCFHKRKMKVFAKSDKQQRKVHAQTAKK